MPVFFNASRNLLFVISICKCAFSIKSTFAQRCPTRTMPFSNGPNTQWKTTRTGLTFILEKEYKRSAEWRKQMEKTKSRLVVAWRSHHLSLSWAAPSLLECPPWWWCRSWGHLRCRRLSQRLRWTHPSPAARPSPGSEEPAPRSPCS